VPLIALVAFGCQRQPETLLGNDADPDGVPLEMQLYLEQSPQEDGSFGVLGLSRELQGDIANMNPEARASLLEVFAGESHDAPPMLGEVSLVDGLLQFEPRYPLRPGVRYRVVFHRSRIPGTDPTAPDVEEDFEVDRPGGRLPTFVIAIYPTADKLPENQLKFYIHFSAPMSRGEAYRRIHLLDVSGKEVDAPFLELGEELWDPDMRRFTLLFDPGRIKRGLKPREEVGPVLEEGKSYTLVVDRDWLNAESQPLEAEARKSFAALPPDDAPLNTQAWKIEAPRAGTSDPLVVRFDEPLDHSLLERMLWITGSTGEKLAGTVHTDEHETRWSFTPETPWKPGEYQLVADTRLEDLAGNSIGRAFDVDLVEPVQKRIETKTVAIRFTVAAP
jgi:hypothetical protein